VDENEPSGYFFREGDLVVVHPEAVVCAIEVKTRLDKKHFCLAADNIYSVNKTALQAGMRRPPAGFIFAFSSSKWSPDRLHSWYKDVTVPDDIRYYPRMVFSLNQGRIDLIPQPPQWGHYRVLGEEKVKVKSASLSVFLAMIKKQLEVKAGKQGNPYEYADLAGQTWPTAYLRFGKGLVSSSE